MYVVIHLHTDARVYVYNILTIILKHDEIIYDFLIEKILLS